MTIDEKSFRLALSHFTSGVTVVTTEHGGERYGMTVASFASLSLDPPLVLACIETRVQPHDAISASGHFGVNILSADQAAISSQFAARLEDRFLGVPTSIGSLGDPLIDGALVQLECSVENVYPGGDHAIFVGLVESAEIFGGSPLVYFGSAYRKLK